MWELNSVYLAVPIFKVFEDKNVDGSGIYEYRIVQNKIGHDMK